MNKLLSTVAIIGLVASGAAFANDAHKATPTKDQTNTAMSAQPAAGAVKHELKDGTQVEVDGDKVFVISKDGAKTAAPDGAHVTKDGKTLNVKGGMLVK